MLKKISKNALTAYVIEFIFSLLFIFLLFKMIYTVNYDVVNSTMFLMTLLMAGCIICVLTIIYKILIHNKGKLHNLFVALMIPIGLLYLVFLIPGQVPDEDAHYYRAYSISTGQLIPQANEKGVAIINVPSSLILTSRQNTEINQFYQKETTNYNNFYQKTNVKNNYQNITTINDFTQAYSPILYTFSAIAFSFSKLINLNVICTLYLARIFNFIFFLILGYYSIKLIPFGKLLMTTYLFIPMVIHQAISVSADSMVNSIVLLFVSFILNLYFKKGSIDRKDRILYYILSVFVALAKTVYTPVIFISLILFFRKNEIENTNIKTRFRLFSKDNRYIWFGILLCLLLASIWFLFVNSYRDGRDYLYSDESSLTQSLLLLKDPIKYVKILGNTISKYSYHYINTFIGGIMGWLSIQINETAVLGYLLLLLASPFLEKHKFELSTKQKILFIMTFGLSAILVFTALYVNYTPDYYNYIYEVQGRYFIPIFILLLLCMCCKSKYINCKYLNIVYPTMIVFLNIIFIHTIICYFI